MKTLLLIKDRLFDVLSRVLRAIAWVFCFLFYWLVVGPYSLVYRLAVPDPLDKEPDAEQPSYWTRLADSTTRPERPY